MAKAVRLKYGSTQVELTQVELDMLWTVVMQVGLDNRTADQLAAASDHDTGDALAELVFKVDGFVNTVHGYPGWPLIETLSLDLADPQLVSSDAVRYQP